MDKERKTIYLCLAHMSEDGMEQKYVKEAFDTNWVVPLGPNVNGFEDDLKAFVSKNSDGTDLQKEVVALSAGTAAVHLALLACGVGPGDEVCVQSLDKAIKEGKIYADACLDDAGMPMKAVTHPDIIRFFMLIPEACKLVLEAGTMGHGGEIFVFDMGQPVKIVDLAKRMIKLSGAKDVEIKFTGLRDGEKLYEEVLNDKEVTLPTFHKKIKIAKVREYDYADVCKELDELSCIAQTFDDMKIVGKMKQIVPEYKSQHSKYQALDK